MRGVVVCCLLCLGAQSLWANEVTTTVEKEENKKPAAQETTPCLSVSVQPHRKSARKPLIRQGRARTGAQCTLVHEHRKRSDNAVLSTDRGPWVVEPREKLRLSYLWDGGMVPFVYVPMVTGLSLHLLASPPETPLLFSSVEGGEPVRGDTVPELAVGAYAVAGAGAIVLSKEPSRWYHLKGYAQAAFTTIALTELAKNIVGRHRPTYLPGSNDVDQRRSFFSGHSSMTASATVYFGLYLYQRVFPQYQGAGATLWKGAALTALGGIAVGVPLTRLMDNRHHPVDVLSGGAVGAATALTFFLYQDWRFEKDHERPPPSRWMAVPDITNRGISLVTQF